MSFGKKLTLQDGTPIPQIGLGIWLSEPNEVERAVEIAIRNGYRHLELACVCRRRGPVTDVDAVGRALKKVIPSVVKREELFITGKLWNNAHRPAEVENQLDQTLQQLGLDYLDLFLMHFPVAFAPGQRDTPTDESGKAIIDKDTTVLQTWRAMLVRPKSKVRNVGVSNFTTDVCKAVVSATGQKPAANQVESHPYLVQDELIAYCKKEGIHLTAYSPLGNNRASFAARPRLTEHPVVKTAGVAMALGNEQGTVQVRWKTHRQSHVLPRVSSSGPPPPSRRKAARSSLPADIHTRGSSAVARRVGFSPHRPRWRM
ncbi:Aldo/keto reductase [Exidia glandulosa HHB12029]|uniref:Aldo/keto reductase n=1 Tax=Exidia glandulosa HHB12029 TaxID=1314781 RepID=A0A165M2Q3_EXIGL|nr:Aldo/keto reductase [Exidia glandulosa HHB12029]